MIFHVVSLPHTNTTSDFVVCAYTEKVRKFCNMMKSLGHTVYLYGGTVTDAECDELITCISEEDRVAHLSGAYYVNANFFGPLWDDFNTRAVHAITQRAEPTDFLCLIGGTSQQSVAQALPHLTCVEFGIGYGGTFADYRVFESYAWMHTVYGAQSNGNAHSVDGRGFDAVIPNYFEIEKFPFVPVKDDFYLYVGRLTERKGYQIAADVCERGGERLLIAGVGDVPNYGEYVGVINEEERGDLMSRAKAVFVPTQYIEPFGGVAVEAMLCGTPVITSDWGAFTETVRHGVDGFRCRTQGEYVDAMQRVGDLDTYEIRTNAIDRFSTDVVALKYQAYFEQLMTLWDKGWHSELSWLSAR